jgi:chromosomal replication initiation ATPase DnaA
MNLIYCIKNNEKLNQEEIDIFGHKITMESIAKKICNYYGISLELMRHKSNHRDYVEPRQIFSYIVHKRKIASLSKIADFLCPSSPFNHATILHGRNNISDLIKNNKYIRKIVYEIEGKI